MIKASSVDELAGRLKPACVTLGNFDGVHLGHRKLISRTKAQAKALGLSSVVITFEPHPLRVLSGRKTPPFITPSALKFERLAELDPDALLVMPFTAELAALPPEEFVRRHLVEGLRARHLVVGYDYSFGKGRRGNFELLTRLGQEHGFTVEQLAPVIIDGAVVSSTRIRDMIQAGDVWDAHDLLGRFFELRGVVVHGKGRGGRLLGFPTANLQIEDELLPKTGVYAAWASLDDALLPAVVNVGYNPTFGNEAVSVEAFLLDFDADLYGATLTLRFVHRLRGERKFTSLDDLKSRIAEDVAIARAILAAPEARPDER